MISKSSPVRTSHHKSLSPRWIWTEEVYFTRHSLSKNLTVFCFWPLLRTDVNPSDQKAILKGKQLCNITRDWPRGTLANFAFLSCTHLRIWRVDLITQGAEDYSTLAMPFQRRESIMSLHNMVSSADERPLSCQNCTPTQNSPFSELTVIPKLAFQASGRLTQSRYFAIPPNPAVPRLWCY